MKDRLTTAPLPLERPQGYFVLFVGRRYYLRWREVSFLGVPKELCSNGEWRRCRALQSLTREATFVSEAISDDSCLI